MLRTILVDEKPNELITLNDLLHRHCPHIVVEGEAKNLEYARKLITDLRPQLVFLEINLSPLLSGFNLLEENVSFLYETIIVTHQEKFSAKATNLGASGFLLKPVQPEELCLAVKNVQKRIKIKEEAEWEKELIQRMLVRQDDHHLIGVPTMEGYEFIPVGEILRCEGLERCTRLVTKKHSNIVSSYNLGEFIKILEPFGFFTSHRSHLINLRYIKKYNREGSVTMADGVNIPVARRKKKEFLDRTLHP